MRTTSRVERVRLLLMVERYKVELGQAIKRRREELGMTQGDLAKLTHYKDGQTVSRWERGENVPSDLDAVAGALEWTLADMVADIEPPNQIVARKLGIVMPVQSTPEETAVLTEEPSPLDRIRDRLDALQVLMETMAGDEVVAAAKLELERRRQRDASGGPTQAS
jgi:transcriptional regulator with XRE-family HTH domain